MPSAAKSVCGRDAGTLEVSATRKVRVSATGPRVSPRGDSGRQEGAETGVFGRSFAAVGRDFCHELPRLPAESGSGMAFWYGMCMG